MLPLRIPLLKSVIRYSAQSEFIRDFSVSLKVAWLRVDTQTILTIQNNVITKNQRVGISFTEKRTWQLRLKDIQVSDKGWWVQVVRRDKLILLMSAFCASQVHVSGKVAGIWTPFKVEWHRMHFLDQHWPDEVSGRLFGCRRWVNKTCTSESPSPSGLRTHVTECATSFNNNSSDCIDSFQFSVVDLFIAWFITIWDQTNDENNGKNTE